jgi:diamine N-acetyltransferase
MVTIKKASVADLDILITLSKQTFFDAFLHLNNPEDMETYAAVAFSQFQMLAEINNQLSCFYFALMDNEYVGYIKLNYGTAQTEFKEKNTAELERIYVTTSYQGKQIGRQLLNFAIETAIEKQMLYLWLGVWENNFKAIKFYEENGFIAFGNHEFVLGNDKQRDILMKKPLINT